MDDLSERIRKGRRKLFWEGVLDFILMLFVSTIFLGMVAIVVHFVVKYW